MVVLTRLVVDFFADGESHALRVNRAVVVLVSVAVAVEEHEVPDAVVLVLGVRGAEANGHIDDTRLLERALKRLHVRHPPVHGFPVAPVRHDDAGTEFSAQGPRLGVDVGLLTPVGRTLVYCVGSHRFRVVDDDGLGSQAINADDLLGVRSDFAKTGALGRVALEPDGSEHCLFEGYLRDLLGLFYVAQKLLLRPTGQVGDGPERGKFLRNFAGVIKNVDILMLDNVQGEVDGEGRCSAWAGPAGQ